MTKPHARGGLIAREEQANREPVISRRNVLRLGALGFGAAAFGGLDSLLFPEDAEAENRIVKKIKKELFSRDVPPPFELIKIPPNPINLDDFKRQYTIQMSRADVRGDPIKTRSETLNMLAGVGPEVITLGMFTGDFAEVCDVFDKNIELQIEIDKSTGLKKYSDSTSGIRRKRTSGLSDIKINESLSRVFLVLPEGVGIISEKQVSYYVSTNKWNLRLLKSLEKRPIVSGIQGAGDIMLDKLPMSGLVFENFMRFTECRDDERWRGVFDGIKKRISQDKQEFIKSLEKTPQDNQTKLNKAVYGRTGYPPSNLIKIPFLSAHSTITETGRLFYLGIEKKVSVPCKGYIFTDMFIGDPSSNTDGSGRLERSLLYFFDISPKEDYELFPEGRVKGELKRLAEAQEEHYRRYNAYAKSMQELKDFAPNPDVSIKINHGGVTCWDATAQHTGSKSIFIYDSSRGGLQP
jgi:hypothetical protein